MAREILFKAKRKDNGEWICWNLYGELCRLSGKRTRLAIKNGATTHYYDYIYQVRQLIDEKAICQYTGLTDRKGNKIWENDIFKHYNRVNFEDFESHTIGLVEWDEIHCRYTNKKWKNNEIYLLNSECVYEVIGNKFDNPELLEVLS